MDPFLRRCLELARIPGAEVEPNPRVGAVVVHDGRIIGEGYHQRYGEPHAEVNAVRSVRDRSLLPHSTIYVSLEPCNHRGKTPPCTSLILMEKIPRVVVGSIDPNPVMGGQSVTLLRNKGVDVEVNPHQEPFMELNRHFWCNMAEGRPFITLKWAESPDGFIARVGDQGPERTAISHPFVGRGLHHLRHDHHAILVGRRTVMVDDPTLSTRRWPGRSPIRIFFDRQLQVPLSRKIMAAPGKTIIINALRDDINGHLHYFRPENEAAWTDLKLLLRELYRRATIGSILVEGGTQVHTQFIQQGLWDEAIRNIGQTRLGTGVTAPVLPPSAQLTQRLDTDGDGLEVYRPG